MHVCSASGQDVFPLPVRRSGSSGCQSDPQCPEQNFTVPWVWRRAHARVLALWLAHGSGCPAGRGEGEEGAPEGVPVPLSDKGGATRWCSVTAGPVCLLGLLPPALCCPSCISGAAGRTPCPEHSLGAAWAGFDMSPVLTV